MISSDFALLSDYLLEYNLDIDRAIFYLCCRRARNIQLGVNTKKCVSLSFGSIPVNFVLRVLKYLYELRNCDQPYRPTKYQKHQFDPTYVSAHFFMKYTIEDLKNFNQKNLIEKVTYV